MLHSSARDNHILITKSSLFYGEFFHALKFIFNFSHVCVLHLTNLLFLVFYYFVLIVHCFIDIIRLNRVEKLNE